MLNQPRKPSQKFSKMAALLVFAICFVALSTNVFAQRERYPIAVGAKHPDFRLKEVESGSPISLSDYSGKKVVLVHFASW